MNPVSATHIQAAHATVTVLSNTVEVTDWALRYFGPWWNAARVAPDAADAGPRVLADVDDVAYTRLTALVHNGRDHEDVTFAKARTRVARDGDDVVAASPTEELAYRSDRATGRLTVVGRRAEPVALAAARLARESVRGQLLRGGWAVLHSSAVVRPADGATVLAFGDKGSGKTTTALLLASRGWSLLANDRIFVRPASTGVDVAPWPSAAALGLGLLDALGWYDIARERLKAGDHLHPTQHQQVTDALLVGRRAPLWEADGRRERKVQVFPDQFPGWFDVPLATGGRVAALLFPQVRADAVPGVTPGGRTLGAHDFMSGRTEDRYPDIFRLAQGIDGGGHPDVRAEVAGRLAELPHHSVILNHDTAGSADFLSELTEGLTVSHG
ncbi:hypothetical protein [Streptomyces sp. NPDC088261]|uniref:hypothetical protein n=1 Tax=Streptomyces sp. NPDC088261 TaxID=3365851 RepID=UPI0038233A10